MSRVFRVSTFVPPLKIADRINKNDEKRGVEGEGGGGEEGKEKKEKAERNANYKNEQ